MTDSVHEGPHHFPGQVGFYSGKVRDVYYLPDRVVVVALIEIGVVELGVAADERIKLSLLALAKPGAVVVELVLRPIAESRKMAYKATFQPLQVLQGRKWRRL